MDVGDWLRSLCLNQYEAVFRANEIDTDVLPELTDQHLKDLGVSLGHRLKICARSGNSQKMHRSTLSVPLW
jgi:hypothetical protein